MFILQISININFFIYVSKKKKVMKIGSFTKLYAQAHIFKNSIKWNLCLPARRYSSVTANIFIIINFLITYLRGTAILFEHACTKIIFSYKQK